MTRTVRPSLLVGWGGVGVILLMGCVNLAHLFLARTIERRQEMSTRAALGASPWHLIRQVMAEVLLVAAIGGGAGVTLAAWTSQLLLKFAANQIPRAESAGFEGPVLLFAVGISLLGGLLFGLPACWQVMRPQERFSEGGSSVTRSRSRLSAVLVAGEVALALLVLAGVALLTRSFTALLQEDPGFRAEQVWTIPNLPLRSDWDKSAAFLATVLTPALLRTPGVVDVAAVNSAPLSLSPTEHSRFATRFGMEGGTFDPQATRYPRTTGSHL